MRLISCLLAACAATAPALEVVRRDVVLAVEALPTDFDFTLDGPSGSTSGSDAFDTVLGLRLGGRWAWSQPGAAGALQLGIDGRLADAQYGPGGTYRTLGLGLSAGYAHVLSRDWTVFAEAIGEYGRASLDLDANATRAAVSADGSHLMYGLRAGALYALSRRWLLSGDLGYVRITSDTTSGDRDFTLEQSGLVIGIGVVWRFSDAPARLE
jgi:hypothetical protein